MSIVSVFLLVPKQLSASHATDRYSTQLGLKHATSSCIKHILTKSVTLNIIYSLASTEKITLSTINKMHGLLL